MLNKALVLVSGGLDSATTLAIVLAQGYEAYALSFDYGQRHQSELKASTDVVQQLKVRQHKTLSISLNEVGGSALTDEHIAVPKHQENQTIPITYVPARNLIFLSYALAWAEVHHINHIFIGINAIDYSGYPDCRPEFIQSFEKTAQLATKIGVEGEVIKIHCPLIKLSKEEIIQKGIELGVDYSLTVSCYQADESGAACGICDSCYYRKAGFEAVGIADPTIYQTT